ncbi:MAG: hypothetical protein U1C74_00625, partial [Phenylobacterium sp.]|nr:hypothetical protein [Phenylobacterium sp.]
VHVQADGCTPGDDYVPYVDRRSDPATLSIARRRIRTCPGAELGYLSLSFPWSVLGLRGGQRVVLLNPVLSRAR